tara:strand:- start:1093 stop:1203 length:111 start_codon:yes stop_codon:yes gene_type:complete
MRGNFLILKVEFLYSDEKINLNQLEEEKLKGEENNY